MATPTPSHPSNPTSASKKHGQHAATPMNFSSPAPRSVPSPAATRKEQAGKTPVNHPTTGSTGSKTLGSTPMVQNLSQSGNATGISPNTNLMGFGTPVGLGVEGLTPSQLNMATPAMGGVPMNMTMSDLGITASGGPKRNEDEERRAKMRKVLKRIGTRKGKLSEDGIARIGRRVGFDNDIDQETLSPDELARRAGNRTISTAGQKLVIDIHMKDHVPQKVQIAFDTENQHLEAQADTAAKVLFNDLCPPDGVPLTGSLDRYATNLGRLAKIDKLCHNQVNCFEALSGVYVSLRRLFEQETKLADELQVMRTRSGRPTMNANGRLGLNLEYWQGAPAKSTGDSKMDVDSRDENNEVNGDDIYKLRIAIEPSHAGLYPSIRLSDKWVPDPLELPSTHSETPGQIPWLDPEPTLIAANSDANAMAIDGNQKTPDLRFVAKVEPPIILPYQIACNVLSTVGVPQPQVFIPQAWHSMLLDPSSSLPFDASRDNKTLHAEKRVLNMASDGGEDETTHHYTLDIIKSDIGFKLEELPFSHPRQLVEILPVLRQWACFGSLIQDAMGKGQQNPKPEATEALAEQQQQQQRLTLADMLTPPTTPAEPAPDTLPVSLTAATPGVPTLSLNFPSASSTAVVNVTAQILPNAELIVTGQQGLPEALENQKIAKALGLAGGDLGVWIEWLRSR
ncbi:hypothetical protein D0869_09489 [Hortaea werneckii]|uniref:Mediator of RNA polymerase II transcription subunit 1 n=1 Tax=Hortaea werneckii TaxID=91943 RepID=A0A3M6ZAY5_HORWE|nr:hypothetical protein KC334_g2984 [Hortaea werneckii]KAI7011117.1 hypothetical protein KC355_g5881 [Hortaea werneckii]KAI7169114.1 hypothetical protein KC324_g11398 [Hortaea werneckii]KAI7574450.1 hypothetical protein KC316_g11484 [Hortaea werneckii]KAI7663045.1 hypothetical protein KC318_g8529 [Hortaea werneckii]